MKVALDVGADDGFHGILFAFLNPKIQIYAFEPIKNSKKKILDNLKKVEIFFGVKVNNYKIINCAISDFNGQRVFYETNYKVASSLLKPKEKLNKFWTNTNDFLIKKVSKGLKIKKKYKVKILTLEKFCKNKHVEIIEYLHIDAQGNDLRVIKGLGKYKEKLVAGVTEVPKNDKFKIYHKEHSLKELRKKFKKWKFNIVKMEEVQKNYPSFNVYFNSSTNKQNKMNDSNFIFPTKRFERMFKRIFSDNAGLKDIIFLYYWKIKVKFL